MSKLFYSLCFNVFSFEMMWDIFMMYFYMFNLLLYFSEIKFVKNMLVLVLLFLVKFFLIFLSNFLVMVIVSYMTFLNIISILYFMIMSFVRFKSSY